MVGPSLVHDICRAISQRRANGGWISRVVLIPTKRNDSLVASSAFSLGPIWHSENQRLLAPQRV